MNTVVSKAEKQKKSSLCFLIILVISAVVFMNESNETKKKTSVSKINCLSSPDPWTSLLYSCAEKESIVEATGSLIEVTAGGQGAIAVKSWDKKEIKIRVVSEAWAETEQASQKILESISYKFDGNKLVGLVSDGKNYDKPWAVNFEITVPNNYQINLNTVNGAIFVDEMKGTISARAVNGAIYFTQVGGKVVGKSVNGRIEARVSGAKWEGESLNLESANGDVAVYFSKDFSAQFNSISERGKIYVQNQTYSFNTLKKSLNEGGNPVNARSGNGSIWVYFQSE